MSIRPFRDIKRKKTKKISVGKVKVGGDNPISVQSMTNTRTTDIKSTINQINKIQSEGADIVRVSCPDEQSSLALKEITKNIKLRDIGTEQCGIISFSIDEKNDPKEIVDKMSKAGFAIGLVDPESTLIDSERRSLPTLLRMAPHYYNTEDEIEKAVKQVSLLL